MTAKSNWKLVPMKPTPEMRQAALTASREHPSFHLLTYGYEVKAAETVYRAMLDAVPACPSPTTPAGVDAVAVKALRWITSPRLGGGEKLIALDCFGNEFARLDIKQQAPEEIAAFKRERQADYAVRIRSALTPAPTPVEAGGEAVATVVWYDPNLDPLAMTPRRIVDPTAKFIAGAALGTKLYALAKPAPAVEAIAWRWRAKDRPTDDWSATTKKPTPADYLTCEIEPLFSARVARVKPTITEAQDA